MIQQGIGGCLLAPRTAATPLELKQVAGSPVVVVGGANSAGQAALYLASSGCPVHLVVRGDDLGARMSSYLVDRIADDPRIHVHMRSHLMALEGDDALEAVKIDTVGDVAARGVFCFIGADPATAWLPRIARDEAVRRAQMRARRTRSQSPKRATRRPVTSLRSRRARPSPISSNAISV